MKRIITNALILLVFMLGLGLVCYPTLSNWYNEQVGSYSIKTYQTVVDSTPYEQYETLLADARRYNSTLTAEASHYISGEAEDEAYINALNVSNGMMGALVIEKIGVNLPIYHGTNEAVLQSSIGHLEGSALPTGEEGMHTVLTGHTGLPSATLLTDLTALELGDTFAVHVLNEVYTYTVYQTVVVEPHEVDELAPIEGKNLVTLVTCTPYGINSHRLFVQGELTSTETITAGASQPTTGPEAEAEAEAESNMPAWAKEFAMLCATGMAEGLRTITTAIATLQASGLLRYWPLVPTTLLVAWFSWMIWRTWRKEKRRKQRRYATTPAMPTAHPVAVANTPKHYATAKATRTPKRAAKPAPKHYAT